MEGNKWRKIEKGRRMERIEEDQGKCRRSREEGMEGKQC